MVHADSTNFAEGIDRDEAYRQVLESAEALMEGQRNWVCNLSNVASLLWYMYQSLDAEVNWAGFYTLDPLDPQQLILGPFQGRTACQTILFSRGVCGAAATTGLTQLVPDVEKFPGHIACDGGTRSEIVVPIMVGDKVVAVLDVDCLKEEGFGQVDREWLEKLGSLLGRGCDW
ncbi:GAF domain-like protein [Pyronema domesticum]|nr:GAF domain-like protein [Pyronema domesticum]